MKHFMKELTVVWFQFPNKNAILSTEKRTSIISWTQCVPIIGLSLSVHYTKQRWVIYRKISKTNPPEHKPPEYKAPL